MAKTARYLPIGILLIVGMGLCLALLVVVNNPTLLAEPTPTATMAVVAVAPTVEPTLERLPDQCTEVAGMTYQLQFADQPGAYSPLVSPDGESLITVEGGSVYLRRSDGTSITLKEDGPPDDALSFLVHWSPDSRRVVYNWGRDLPLYLVDLEAGHDELRLIAQLDFPRAFMGWSPDGRYFVIQEDYLADITVWTADGERTYTSDDRQLVVDQSPVWSPDGEALVYPWRVRPDVNTVGLTPYGFTLVNADGASAADITLTDTNATVEPIRQQYHWSPDSRFIAVTYLQYVDFQYLESVRIYDRAGTLVGEIGSQIGGEVYGRLLSLDPTWNAIHWSGDVTLAYTRQLADKLFDLVVFDAQGQIFTTAYERLPKPPFYPNGRGGSAVYVGGERPYSIDITPDGTTRIPFIQNASDAGDPDWSPNGEWVAAVWATGEKANRKVFLSWMRPDGGERQDIDGDFVDVRDLRWLKERRELVYLAEYAHEERIEIVDTVTGARRTLVEALTGVYDLAYDEGTDLIAFRWLDDEGFTNKAVYRPDGEWVSQYRYETSPDRRFTEFPSPDGGVIAIKSALLSVPRRDEQLMLAYADGRPPVVIRRGLTGLGDPLWSPDGQLLAFTQARASEPVSLQIVDTAGADVWDIASYPLYRQIEWQRCG